jgi:hypothetical protein
LFSSLDHGVVGIENGGQILAGSGSFQGGRKAHAM